MKKILFFFLYFFYFVSCSYGFDITLRWDANAEEDHVIGYMVYQSSISGQYTYGESNAVAIVLSPTTTVTLYNVPEGTWYWIVTAYNSFGEDGASNEVTNYEEPIPDTIPPNAPIGLRIVSVIMQEEDPPVDEVEILLGNVSNTNYTTALTDGRININTTNYATDTSLNTYTWPENTVANRIIIKLDLSMIPIGATIVNAFLSLYMFDSGGDDLYEITTHKIINHNPVLTECNWNVYAGTNAWTGGSNGGIQDMASTEDVLYVDKIVGYKQWSIKNMVQEFVDNSSTNYGIMLDSDSIATRDSYRFFRSTEYSDPLQRPKVIITYTMN